MGMRTIVAAVVAAAFAAGAQAQAPATKTIKVQSTWPASITLQDHLRILAERIDKLTAGAVKIEAMSAGQIVPPFEVLDATNKKVLDGYHAISYYWVGKSPTMALFAGPPCGPFGMDHMDYLGWLYVAGGLEMWREFYQKEMKLDIIMWPAHPSSPQALGWFKKPLRSVADFKGMKCRQTGLNAEIYAKLGQSVVNMAGGEIVPAAQRGVIDCAEWVGGVEDLRLGLYSVFKYHYTPGMHENNSVGELGFNLDVWKSFTPAQQEAVNSAVKEASAARRTWRVASIAARSSSPSITAARILECSSQSCCARRAVFAANTRLVRSRSVRMMSHRMLLRPASASLSWNSPFRRTRSSTLRDFAARLPCCSTSRSSPTIAGLWWRAARRALRPSSVARTSTRSRATSGETSATEAPRRGCTSTRPSPASTRSASRTGMRETPGSSDRRPSIRRSPGRRRWG